VRRRRSSSGLLAVTRSGFTRSRICDCKSNITSIQRSGAQIFSTNQWRFQRPQLDTNLRQFHPQPVLICPFYFLVLRVQYRLNIRRPHTFHWSNQNSFCF
jgi:hypothetical protein